MKALILVDELTDLIGHIVHLELGDYNVNLIPSTIVKEALDYYNELDLTSAQDNLVDAFVKGGVWTQENMHRVDNVTALFSRMFMDNANTTESKVWVEYDSATNTAFLEVLPRQIDSSRVTMDTLKKEYHHANEHCDFLPERLRRAFDEICR